MQVKAAKGPKSIKNRRVLIIVLLVLVVVTLGTLGGILVKRAVERGKNQLGDKKITYKGNEGEFSFEEGGNLPEGFPSDFPLYPGTTLSSSWTAKGQSSNGISLIWETDDSSEKVLEFYKRELEAKGWKITSAFSATYSFEKGNTSGFVGIAKGSSGRTEISLTLSLK